MPDPLNLIVFSRLELTTTFGASVLNKGGVDVLLTPFEPEEVLRVIHLSQQGVAEIHNKRAYPGIERPNSSQLRFVGTDYPRLAPW
jgi:hypothetical protein